MKNYIRILIYKIAIFITIIFTLLCGQIYGQNVIASESIKWNQGEVIFYQNHWVEVIVGNMPLVISVPHGGFMKPEGVPDRDCKGVGKGKFVIGADSKTIQTARAIQAAFQKKYNVSPFIIISNIARSKVDQNRDIDLAACDNELARNAWYDFHNGIDTALAMAVKLFGRALYIDLHGHGHKNQRLELGYDLNADDLRKAYNQEGSLEAFFKTSSLQNYLKLNDSANFKEMIWGEEAFGTLINKQGIPATPSSQDHFPLNDEKFFAGGYNTRRYTSSDYPNVFGWQIESNYKGVRDTEESREAFAESFSKVIMQYMEIYIGNKPKR